MQEEILELGQTYKQCKELLENSFISLYKTISNEINTDFFSKLKEVMPENKEYLSSKVFNEAKRYFSDFKEQKKVYEKTIDEIALKMKENH